MVNLIELSDFVQSNYESDTPEYDLITNYETHIKKTGYYYSGGQFSLSPSDEIKIPPVIDPYANACNSWECMSIQKHNNDILILIRLVAEHSAQVTQKT